MRKSSVLIVVCLTCLCFSQVTAPTRSAIAPELQAAIDHIRPSSLRGDLSFLASDLLEGRDTPSRGLDIAAEYIAAQFGSAGLEPGGDDGYFQSARMAVSEAKHNTFELKLSRPAGSLSANSKDLVIDASTALDLSDTPVFKLDLTDTELVQGLTAGQVEGKVILTEFRRGAMANARIAFEKLREAKPAVIVTIDSRAAGEDEPQAKRLVDPEIAPAPAPRITLAGPDAARFYGALKAGLTDAVASIHAAAPSRTPVTLHNVMGILRGSDPA